LASWLGRCPFCRLHGIAADDLPPKRVHCSLVAEDYDPATGVPCSGEAALSPGRQSPPRGTDVHGPRRHDHVGRGDRLQGSSSNRRDVVADNVGYTPAASTGNEVGGGERVELLSEHEDLLPARPLTAGRGSIAARDGTGHGSVLAHLVARIGVGDDAAAQTDVGDTSPS